MTIQTITQTVRAYARARKQRLLADADHFLLVIREGETVAVLSSGNLNRLLGLAATAAAGYGADTMAVVIEGVFPLVPANPLTGQPWQRGEAERLWLEHDGAGKGWVSETQILAVALRSGATINEACPFELSDGTLTWGAAPLDLSRTGLAEAVAGQLKAPAVDPARVPDPGDGFAGDPENGPFYEAGYGRIVLDVGCTRILAGELLGHGEACLVVTSRERADYLIGEGLHSWQVELSGAADTEG